MKRMMMTAALALMPALAAAQTDTQQLLTWLGTQQVNVGTGFSLHRTKYAVSWWDAVSVGQSGINVGKAGAKDYLDTGLGWAVSNRENPRYGEAVPVHLGNAWNAVRLPTSVAQHVSIASVPNVTVTPMFLWPDHKSLDKWRWDADFMAAVAYRFGGATP